MNGKVEPAWPQMHRRKPRKSGRKGVVLSSEHARFSLFLFVHVHRRNRSYSSRGRQWPTKHRNYRKWERKGESTRDGFYPSSINDLANDSNVRLVTTLVNRAPPSRAHSLKNYEFLRVSRSHPSERKKEHSRFILSAELPSVSLPRITSPSAVIRFRLRKQDFQSLASKKDRIRKLEY